jgi:hypothetical protein
MHTVINKIIHNVHCFIVLGGYIPYCSSYSIVRGDLDPVHLEISRLYYSHSGGYDDCCP